VKTIWYAVPELSGRRHRHLSAGYGAWIDLRAQAVRGNRPCEHTEKNPFAGCGLRDVLGGYLSVC